MSIGRRFVGALLSQVVNAGGTFALTTYCLSSLDKPAFGEFSFAYGGIFLIGGLLVAVTGPAFSYAVAQRAPDQRATLLTDTVVASLMLGLLGLPAVLCFVPIAGASLVLVAATFLSSMAFIARDIYTRAAYSEKREGLLLWSNVVSSSISLLGVVAIGTFTTRLTAGTAMTMFGLGQVMSAMLLHFKLRRTQTTTSVERSLDVLSTAWQTGRFALLASASFHARTQLPVFIAAAVSGAAGIAEINAARLYVQPFYVGMSPLSNLTVAHFAGKKPAKRSVTVLSLGFVSAGIVYSALLGVAALSGVLPAPTGYDHLFSLMFLWCAHACALAVRIANYALSEALNAQKTIAKLSAWSLLGALLLTWPLLHLFGVGGAVLSLALAELLLALGLYQDNVRTAADS